MLEERLVDKMVDKMVEMTVEMTAETRVALMVVQKEMMMVDLMVVKWGVERVDMSVA